MIENKVSIWIKSGISGDVYNNYGFESQYELASDITINYQGTTLGVSTDYGDMDLPYTSSYKMSKGILKTGIVKSSHATTSAPVVYSGNTVEKIVSITPESDDKYIYTF